MTELNLKPKIKQIIQIHDHKTNQDLFLCEKGGEWIHISEEEYNKIRGE